MIQQINTNFNITNSQNIFFTSDTHFCHDNIIKYCNRPYKDADEMNEALINNWNKTVSNDDIIFHLGDIGLAGPSKMKEILESLNGNIYLIIGNHDRKNLKQGYMNRFKYYSSEMYIKVDGQEIYLNHKPMLTYDGIYKPNPTWQLFGHVHSGPNNKPNNNPKSDLNRLKYLFPMQYDVGVDNNNFTPISFEEVRNKIQQRLLENPIITDNK